MTANHCPYDEPEDYDSYLRRKYPKAPESWLVRLLRQYYHPRVLDYVEQVYQATAHLDVDTRTDIVLRIFKLLTSYTVEKGIEYVAEHPEWVLRELKRVLQVTDIPGRVT